LGIEFGVLKWMRFGGQSSISMGGVHRSTELLLLKQRIMELGKGRHVVLVAYDGDGLGISARGSCLGMQNSSTNKWEK